MALRRFQRDVISGTLREASHRMNFFKVIHTRRPLSSGHCAEVTSVFRKRSEIKQNVPFTMHEEHRSDFHFLVLWRKIS